MPKWIFYIIPFLLIGLIACHTRARFPPGGYPYPEKVADKDTNFYFYPIKDKESRLDSFRGAFDYVSYQAFQEPNLSLKPEPKPVFRLAFNGFKYFPIIISLRSGEITVKKGGQNTFYEMPDTNKLSPLERRHLRILESNFPIEENRSKRTDVFSVKKRRWLDSMSLLYPQLHDASYYRYLVYKESVPLSKPFTYSLTKIKVSQSEYDSLISLINASGYWQLPYEIKCAEEYADGFSYSLEANTAYQYNIVQASICKNDTDKFALACQEFIKAAHMDKEINLIWDGKYDSVTVPVDLPEVKLEEVTSPTTHKHKKAH